jgi:hypothetical protein
MKLLLICAVDTLCGKLKNKCGCLKKINVKCSETITDANKNAFARKHGSMGVCAYVFLLLHVQKISAHLPDTTVCFYH